MEDKKYELYKLQTEPKEIPAPHDPSSCERWWEGKNLNEKNNSAKDGGGNRRQDSSYQSRCFTRLGNPTS